MTSMWRTSGWVLLGSALILALSLGVRHGFCLFLAPMSSEFGWGVKPLPLPSLCRT